MINKISKQNKEFLLTLLYEEKNRLISRFRKKANVDVAGTPCDFQNKMYQVRELISILGDCDD
jgi:hypothetical protein